jgi:hypothetical protein
MALTFTEAPSVTAKTGNSYTLGGTLSEEGNVFAVAVLSTDTAPTTPQQIILGNDGDDAAARGAGSAATNESGVFSFDVTGGTLGNDPIYDIHVVGRTIGEDEPEPEPGYLFDSFTNTNGTLLTTHNQNWVFVGAAGTDVARIYDNGLSHGTWTSAYYYRADSDRDSSQIVLLAGEPGSTGKVSVTVRSSSGVTGYEIRLTGTGDNWTDLNFYKNSLWVVATTGLSYAKSSNHTLKVVASGTEGSVTVYGYVNGSLLLTRVDSSSVIASGHPGVRTSGNGGNNYAFADDWTDE